MGAGISVNFDVDLCMVEVSSHWSHKYTCSHLNVIPYWLNCEVNSWYLVPKESASWLVPRAERICQLAAAALSKLKGLG